MSPAPLEIWRPGGQHTFVDARVVPSAHSGRHFSSSRLQQYTAPPYPQLL